MELSLGVTAIVTSRVRVMVRVGLMVREPLRTPNP